jgi:hypothetical protein
MTPWLDLPGQDATGAHAAAAVQLRRGNAGCDPRHPHAIAPDSALEARRA